MPTFKAAYLIHGDDHGRIGERRARLRAMAEQASGASAVEVLEGDTATPAAVAQALSAMTFALGRRFVIADGVERWKEGDVTPVAAVMGDLDAVELTVAFFAREDGRLKAPKALHEAVKAAGGVVAQEATLKPRELPRWLGERAEELDVTLDTQAARALIAQIGDRQQRLLREVEKLALEYGPEGRIGTEEVLASSASSAEHRLWTLADALVGGDERAALRSLVELRAQGERLPGLLFGMVRRLREALAIAEALAAGRPAAEIRKSLRMPSFAADRLIADARRRDVEALRRALEVMADLELESRGGAGGALGEDSAVLRAVLTATG